MLVYVLPDIYMVLPVSPTENGGPEVYAFCKRPQSIANDSMRMFVRLRQSAESAD